MGSYHNGVTAENLAEKYQISRQEQDEWALLSQQRAADAIQKGVFEEEILPIQIRIKKETVTFKKDEHPRIGITMDRLSRLKPAFKEGGTVSPGNSSGINDGAGAVVLMAREKAEELGIQPLLKIKSFAVAG